MKKKLGDLTIRELDEYCNKTNCQHCAFNKGNYECYNLIDLFNEMEFYDKHELEFEVKEDGK